MSNFNIDETEKTENKTGLKRTIGVLGGAGLIVGCILGSGIFVVPKEIFETTGSIGGFMSVWIICGIISIFGGLCFAELGTTIPKSGAEYNYIMDSFGPVLAFLFIWTSVFIIKPSSVTIIAITSAKYIGEAFFQQCIVPEIVVKLLSAVIISI